MAAIGFSLLCYISCGFNHHHQLSFNYILKIKLIGKKNPVATLATLLLLSYAKLLEICFKSLSIGVLKHPDGSSEMLWLPDATIRYLTGTHNVIPLFIVTIFVLLVGLTYTALLFSWQWLVYLPRWKIFRWSRHPKVQTLIEAYNTHYTPKHRYWTGLLLIVLNCFIPCAGVGKRTETQSQSCEGTFYCRANAHTQH